MSPIPASAITSASPSVPTVMPDAPFSNWIRVRAMLFRCLDVRPQADAASGYRASEPLSVAFDNIQVDDERRRINAVRQLWRNRSWQCHSRDGITGVCVHEVSDFATSRVSRGEPVARPGCAGTADVLASRPRFASRTKGSSPCPCRTSLERATGKSRPPVNWYSMSTASACRPCP